jgi:hypothetical protein
VTGLQGSRLQCLEFCQPFISIDDDEYVSVFRVINHCGKGRAHTYKVEILSAKTSRNQVRYPGFYEVTFSPLPAFYVLILPVTP